MRTPQTHHRVSFIGDRCQSVGNLGDWHHIAVHGFHSWIMQSQERADIRALQCGK